MLNRCKQWVEDMREGGRILASRDFWRSFRDYYNAKNISARMDRWVSRYRDQEGMDPDWDVERRIAKRKKEEK